MYKTLDHPSVRSLERSLGHPPGLLKGQTAKRAHKRTDGRTAERTHGRTNKTARERTDERTDERTNAQTGKRTDGRTRGRRTDGHTGERTNGTNERTQAGRALQQTLQSDLAILASLLFVFVWRLSRSSMRSTHVLATRISFSKSLTASVERTILPTSYVSDHGHPNHKYTHTRIFARVARA